MAIKLSDKGNKKEIKAGNTGTKTVFLICHGRVKRNNRKIKSF